MYIFEVRSDERVGAKKNSTDRGATSALRVYVGKALRTISRSRICSLSHKAPDRKKGNQGSVLTSLAKTAVNSSPSRFAKCANFESVYDKEEKRKIAVDYSDLLFRRGRLSGLSCLNLGF